MYGVCVRLQFPSKLRETRESRLRESRLLILLKLFTTVLYFVGFYFHTIEFYYYGAEVVLICVLPNEQNLCRKKTNKFLRVTILEYSEIMKICS